MKHPACITKQATYKVGKFKFCKHTLPSLLNNISPKTLSDASSSEAKPTNPSIIRKGLQ